MNTFITTLKTEQVGKWNHNLLDVLIFEDEEVGTVIVPAGFSTDFASIKVLHNAFLFIFFALVSEYGNYAAVIHDYLYTTHSVGTRAITRKEADDVLYRALRAEGVAKWRAWLFWVGVRLGGKASYEN
jgi:hypothetical protein